MKAYSLFLYTVFAAIGVFAVACSADKGNYDYTTLNEVTIDSINGTYTLEAGAQFYIEPDIKSLDETTADLSYSWTIEGEEVSQERVLDITLPPLSFQTHLCALTVTDNVSGMQYRQTFNLSIVNPFNYGYFFLTEREDNSTEVAYIQAVPEEDGGPTMDDVKYVTSCGDYIFGNNPSQVLGNFFYNSGAGGYQWNLTFLTEEGDNQVIMTDNLSFLPSTLISDANFIDQESGYVFKPEATVIDQMNNQYFISNGQFVRYVSGKLYRPARHDKEYYWSNPAFGARGDIFCWVYDEISHKYYSIAAYTADDPAAGIYADEYAYDKVLEPANNQEIEGKIIYASDALNGLVHTGTVYSAANDGIHVYSFTKTWRQDDPALISVDVLPLNNMSETTAFALGSVGISNRQWFFGTGTDIYYSPTTAPNLQPWLSLPIDLGLGEIEYLGLSALGTRMIVVLYDENSTAERKGSVLFIDFATKEITHTFPHIMHHCVSYCGANAAPNPNYGSFGDDM